MLNRILKAATTCNFVLTETTIESEPQIVLIEDHVLPEIENRFITFGLSEGVEIEDIRVTLFDIKTINGTKYVNPKGNCLYFSVKYLLDTKLGKEVELTMGKLGIINIKDLETKYLKKLNDDLKKTREGLKGVLQNELKNALHNLGDNNDLWEAFFTIDFYDSLLNIEVVSKEAIEILVASRMASVFIERTKQAFEKKIKSDYTNYKLYFTDFGYKEEVKKNNTQFETDPVWNNAKVEDFKYTIEIKSELWNIVETCFSTFFPPTPQYWGSKPKTGNTTGFLSIDIFCAILYSKMDGNRTGNTNMNTILCLISNKELLEAINEEQARKSLFTIICDIIPRNDISNITTSYRNHYDTVVEIIMGTLKPYSILWPNINCFKAIKQKLKEYTDLSQNIDNQDMKGALDRMTACLEACCKSAKDFQEQTRIFNILNDQSVAFNFSISFKGLNDQKIVVPKYYTVKNETLEVIGELPILKQPVLDESAVHHTGLLNNPWFYIDLIAAFVVLRGILIYLMNRGRYTTP